jgi:hypothetical protein
VEELRRRNDDLDSLFAAIISGNIGKQKARTVYSRSKTSRAALCFENHEDEIRRLKRKVSLLEN